MNNKRVIIVVIDSLGCGALPDANDYGDDASCNTLCNIADAVGGLNVFNFEKLGLGNILPIKGVTSALEPIAQYGAMKMASKGKDTTTGHWEIAGLVLDCPFKTYKKFPDILIDEFIKKTNCGGVLGNVPASGTAIITELNDEHTKTKFPIVYTSADSVFQIAVNIDIIPLETLYEWCKIARKILDDGNYGISRVIARPYHLLDRTPSRIGKYRHDYSVVPPKPTLLNDIQNSGGKVLGIGKIKDIFVGSGVDESIPTGSNSEGLEMTLTAIKDKKDFSLIFTNLVDTDMLYGHRRDPKGYAGAIEKIDSYLSAFMNAMDSNDMLVITADHGCDPTFKGSDHTREMVPLMIYEKNIKPESLGVKESFTYVSARAKNWLEMI